VKKHESQISELDKLKLKVIILHDGIGKEVHMTQPVRSVVTDLATIDMVSLARWSSFGSTICMV